MVTRLSLISLLILLVVGAVAALQPEHRASHRSPRNPVSGRDREPRARVPQYTRLVFDDNFSGPAGSSPSSARWTHDIGAYGWPDHELETDTASDANAGLTGTVIWPLSLAASGRSVPIGERGTIRRRDWRRRVSSRSSTG